MTDKQLLHPEKDELVAFGLGKLEPDEATKIETHLGECEACCETLLDLKDDTFVELVRKSPEPKQPTHDADDNVSSAKTEPADGVATDDAITAETMLVESGVSRGPTDLPAQLEDHPRYRIIELIGKGGMGDVYKAEHRLMDRPVALKFINQDLVKNTQAVERFRREVQAAARLTHANIVTAFDAEQAGDVHFLAMEFVEATDLATVVKNRGALPVNEACEYIRQAAEGLQHAHEKGMVHRDIKPHNLMLSPDGQVRILDFGLAGFATESAMIEADSTGGEDEDTPPLHLTTFGSVMGTPDYIAPEQAHDAHSADIRADIYSLGCTLCYLLTGETPFAADSVVEKLKAHVEQERPALNERRDDVPRELADVISRMMAKEPDDRFQTPAEVSAALAPFAGHESQAVFASEPPRRPLRRFVLWSGIVTLLGAVIYIATTKGNFEVRSEVDGVKVTVSRDGESFRVLDVNSGTSLFWLPADGFEVTAKGDTVVTVSRQRVVVNWMGRQIIEVRRASEPNEDAQAIANDRRLLEDGRWKVVKFMGYAGAGTKPKVQQKSQDDGFIVFEDNKIIYLSESGEVPRREDEFRITNASSTPKTFENVTWPPAESNVRPTKFIGVYDLQGDNLKLYFGPDEAWLVRFESEFKSQGPRAATVYFELKREQSVELKGESRLQGKWVPVSGQMRTKVMTAEQLTNMSVTFEGKRVTLTDPDSGRPIPSGTFTVDMDRDPNHITMTAPDGSETLPGIFQIDGYQLRLAWVDEDYARPTDFSPSDTADHMTLVLEQAPLAGPAPGETERDVLKAANEFLAVMDAGTFGQLYDMSASWAKQKTTRGKTSQTHQKIRDSFGKAVQRTLYRAHQIDQDPNLPKGRYAVVLYKSRFERQPVLWEALVLNVDTDGQWRVITYAWTLEPPTLPAPKTNDAPATTQRKQAALTAAQAWLKLVDAAKYGGAWEACAEQTRKADDKQTLFNAYTRLFQSSGTLKSRDLLTNKYATDPSGEFVNIQYDTQFAKTRVTETVALTREKDDRWRVSGYFHEPRPSAPTPLRQTPPQRKTGILTNPPNVPEDGLPTGKNLIGDPSLEDTRTGQLPKGWFAWLDDGPDFKCEVVEGGVTGKHCLQISGTGTRGVVFATSIPMDRTKRYALKGQVRVEGEAGTWAVIKLNYFNKSGWLGVDDRVGVTTSNFDWKFFEKTDFTDKYPSATLIVPTCHIEGSGTAWFDDLEVVAFDRDKLPDNFNAKHGKNNRNN